VTRPSFIAACISGIVASTTLKNRRFVGARGSRARVCPHKVVAADSRKTTGNASFLMAYSIPIKQESNRCSEVTNGLDPSSYKLDPLIRTRRDCTAQILVDTQ
jgi:hypothetical protein